MSANRIRVASIPSAHPYVAHLSDPDADPHADPVRRLPDPVPEVADPLPGQWWPPVMLEPAWVRDHTGDFDVMHLHFGFDAATPESLRQWITALRDGRKPLVFTVHDLVNPHFADPTTHLAHLDVLIPAADAVITLTDGAAAEIARHWGREATVVPHPHVVPLDRIATPSPPADRFVIGVSAKNLRANIDPVPVLEALLPALSAHPTAVLQVDVHREVMDPARGDARAMAFREWVDRHRDHPQLTLLPHDRFSDEELFDHLTGLDLSVLPYRFGTHSGWLEACVDLGTGVLVPDTGHYRDQHGHPTYRFPGTADPTATGGPERTGGAGCSDPTGPTDLATQLGRILDGRIDARPARPQRRDQRRQVALHHLQVYRGVLTRASG